MITPTIHEQKFIHFCTPIIEEEEINEVLDTLKSGWLTTGKKVIRFEEQFCERLQVKNAIAVNSATSGWHLLAHALEIGPGDEVIIPSITWPSIANVVELLGAKPVFADVDPNSLQLLPSEVERLITPKTKAVIPVHFAGAPFDIDAIKLILKDKSIHLIEDAAHAIGTSYKGNEVGNGSSLAIFSFHPIKNITTGEGGMIICNDDLLADKLRLMRFHGISKDAWKRYAKGGTPEFEVVAPGFKFNMMDIQAAIGVAQFLKLDRFNQRRTEIAHLYEQLLAPISEVQPLINAGYTYQHAWHLFIIRLDLSLLSINRNEFIHALGEENIGAGIHFPAIHLMRYYKEKYAYSVNDLPNATKAGNSILSLPLHPGMTNEDVYYVVHAIKKIIGKHKL